MTMMLLVKHTGIKMARTIVCPVCKKEWDFRVGFAHESLNKHLKEHRK